MSTAYHPQTDGASERTNQTVENVLRSMVGYGVDEDWSQKLDEIELCINTSVHATTQVSPFEVLYGYKPRLVGDLLESFDQDDKWLSQREILRKEVSNAIADANSVMAKHYDIARRNIVFQAGDKVYVRNRPGLVIPGQANDKLSSRYFGPFDVVERVGETAYRLKLPLSYRMHDVINIQHLKKAPLDEFNRTSPPAPLLAVDQDEGWEEYEVERVIDRRNRHGKVQYLAKFKDYPVSDSIWYDEKDSESFRELVTEYNTRVNQGLALN